jgi:hypothetical protein
MASISSGRLEKFSIGRVFSNTFSVIGRSFGPLAVIVGLFTTLPALIYNYWNFSRLASFGVEGVAGMEQAALENYGFVSMIAALVIFVLASLPRRRWFGRRSRA